MIIYQITNNVNGDFYIGKTIGSLKSRFRRHLYNAKSGSKTHLYSAIRKYGADNFSISLIENVSNNINEREIYWISKLNPKYNMTSGGDGGNTSNSPNYKLGMSKYHAKKSSKDYATYGMLNKKMPEEGKKKISKANSCSIICYGIEFTSIKEAQNAYPGISVRKRLDSKRYPDFYRLDPKKFRPMRKKTCSSIHNLHNKEKKRGS
jgi:group I intron endonuclease